MCLRRGVTPPSVPLREQRRGREVAIHARRICQSRLWIWLKTFVNGLCSKCSSLRKERGQGVRSPSPTNERRPDPLPLRAYILPCSSRRESELVTFSTRHAYSANR